MGVSTMSIRINYTSMAYQCKCEHLPTARSASVPHSSHDPPYSTIRPCTSAKTAMFNRRSLLRVHIPRHDTILHIGTLILIVEMHLHHVEIQRVSRECRPRQQRIE